MIATRFLKAFRCSRQKFFTRTSVELAELTDSNQSRQDLAHHLRGFDAGEFLIEAAVGVGEAMMVEAELVEHGGVEVADVVRILGNLPTEIVGRADGMAALDAGSGHPDGEAAAMMVAAGHGRTEFALRVNGAAELTAPDDERVFQQAALFEIEDERGGGLVGVAAPVAAALALESLSLKI